MERKVGEGENDTNKHPKENNGTVKGHGCAEVGAQRFADETACLQETQ